jgi:hypothetical protein
VNVTKKRCRNNMAEAFLKDIREQKVISLYKTLSVTWKT